MLRLVIYIVGAILVLSFLGVSLQGLIENPTTQENFRFFISLLEQGWESVVAWLSAVIDPILAPFAALLD